MFHKRKQTNHMETSATPKPRFWRRAWFRLMVWSALVAAGMMLWQAQKPEFWAQGSARSTGPAIMVAGFLFCFILALIPSYICVRAWRNRPTSRKGWLGFGLAAVALGISDYLLQMHLDPGNVAYYSPIFFSTWLLIHAAIVVIGLLFLYSLRHFLKWLVSWRIVKRVIILALSLATLITLFYTEANWRGRRAWAQYRQEWEATGEKVTYADFAPPPVPDAQNVAMAPLLADSFAGRWIATTNRDEETIGTNHDRLDLELWRTNTMNLWNGDFGKWQLSQSIRLQDWQTYYRARFVTNGQFPFTVRIQSGLPGMLPGMPPNMPRSGQMIGSQAPALNVITLGTNEFPISEQPQTPAADVLLALSRYKPVLVELAQALQRPQARFPLDYTAKDPQEIPYPHLADLKRCTTVLQLRACAELPAGQDALALADVEMILRLADTIRPEPDWISFQTRSAIIDQAIQPIWEGLAARQWSEADLKELNHLLQSLDLVAEGQAQWHAERAKKIAYIEYVRQHRDELAIWLAVATSPKAVVYLGNLLDKIPPPPEPAQELLEMFVSILPTEAIGRMVMSLPPDGWYEWNKVSLAKFYQEQIFAIADAGKHHIDPQKVRDINSLFVQQREILKISPHDALVFALLPGVANWSEHIARTQNAVDLANIACGLEQFHIAHGNYPASLNALVPDFLPALPPDVITGEPLQYHPTPAGSFVLYSVGLNGRDDGGIVITNQYEGIDFSAGDWVWQYPKP